MAEPQITVSILSWLLEDRLIKTLIQIPRTTPMPLNLCLHVQASEQISNNKRREILDASSAFVKRDIFFTEGNAGSAGPRAVLLKRSAKTPFIFITDNDMVFQEGSIDALYKFMSSPDNSSEYGMIDLVHNFLPCHRCVVDGKVITKPVNLKRPNIADVDLIGAASILMRQEVALIPDIIDTRYSIGTWDIDMCMNVKAHGWKIATYCDRKLIAINDKTYRPRGYKSGRVLNRVKEEGTKLFEKKWGFSSEFYRGRPKEISKGNVKAIKSPRTDTIVVSRAIYSRMGRKTAVGVLDEARLEMMQRFFINSLRNQTNKDFVVYLAVGTPENVTTNRIKMLDWGDLDVRFIYTHGNTIEWERFAVEKGNWAGEAVGGSPESILRRYSHPFATIMARLDTDDWVAPGWIAHMKHMAVTKPETHFLINYRVIGQDADGRLYRFFAPHNPARTSPFIALVQKVEPRISPYADIHLRMGSKFSTVYSIAPSYCFMVVHGGNRSNRLYPGDVYFGDFEEHWIKDEKPVAQAIHGVPMLNEAEEKPSKVRSIGKMSKDNWKTRMSSN